MTQTSLSETQSSVEIGTLAKNAATILSLQAAGVTLTYLAQVFLARWMGKIEYGIYEYVISWSLVLAIPASLGLPRTVLRFISEYRVRHQWGELRGLILSSWQLTAGVGLLLCLAATEIISFLDRQDSFIYAPVLLVGIWLVPLQALIQLQEDMARGADNIPLAYGPSKVLWPLFVLGSGFFLFHQNHDLTSIPMIRVALQTLLIVVVFQVSCLWFKFNREIGDAKPIYKPRQWLLVALPLLLDHTFDVLLTQTDILMVGSLVGAGAVGIYSAAVKTALWASFVLQSLNFVAAPAYAILYAKGDREGLQKIVGAVTLWIFAPSVAISLSLVIFAQPILSVFGPEFVAAQWALKILIIGQLVDVLCGSVGNLMVMTGHQNQSVVVSSCCALANVILNAILIPKFGAAGAAIATTCTLVTWNVWMCILVIKYIKINPSILYSFGIGKNFVSD
ncbi:lipopolysaccharide biosynthesis protein [Spirulina sp. 06S082]|uniref:lipopolysaccharide biosynthesis protein n=1 Tax=Spirulina sp. 06S082 TaxID=3110248 RepID=UPI002B1FBBA8|nr:oligosaccharide flippase family protein [Spirulina sp. 06S082]MEA5472491.1 oligosaccharide flippase family protein [Spirulina sp. 06S082]